MSFEAKAALLEFYKVRSRYLETAINRSKNKPHVVKDPDDPTVFPFSYHTARQMWSRLLDKSGYGRRDKTTGRYIMHIHTLRKFFRSNMTYSGGPVDVAEALMGHEGYLPLMLIGVIRLSSLVVCILRVFMRSRFLRDQLISVI